MEYIKQYLLQGITVAASNIRLNNQRIEILAMLKEVISKSKDIHGDLIRMKKITELSKLAIKFSEMVYYLEEGSIDFLKLSDKFREQSFNLIKELTHMLDLVNPQIFKATLERLIETEHKIVEIIVDDEVNLVSKFESNIPSLKAENAELASSGLLQSRLIAAQEVKTLKDEQQQFNSFENNILSPIKSIDTFLSEIIINTEVPDQVNDYLRIIKVNANLSKENGFEILTQMHEILAEGLTQLKSKSLIPSKEIIESLRACLIVIVAVVKSKEVDITNYLKSSRSIREFFTKA